MKTESVLIQTLCAPCGCRCRYCLLNWNGKTEGADWDRSVSLANRWIAELKERLPGIKSDFSFGYSMEHPDLPNAIRTLGRLGSPSAEFLQCDGMKMRNESECRGLAATLKAEGVKSLNFTLYGLPEYHDRFAARKGDFELILRMIKAAGGAGLFVSAGVPLTKENAGQADGLVEILKSSGCGRIRFLIPHEEGRGKSISEIRLTGEDFLKMSEENRKLLNKNVFKREREWPAEPVSFDRRMILISLREDNIEEYEKRDAMSVVRDIERLDEEYYAAFPDFKTLAEMYGDKNGDKIYGIRDLYARYRAQYAKEHGVRVYDVTDERYSGSRRY